MHIKRSYSSYHIFFLFIFVFSIYSLAIKKQVSADWQVDPYGNLIYTSQGEVLGKDEDSAKSEDSDESSSGSSGSGSSPSSGSGSGSQSDSSDSDSSGGRSSGSDASQSGASQTTSAIGMTGPAGQTTTSITSAVGPTSQTGRQTSPDLVKTETNGDKTRTEIKFGEGEKIKIRSKPGEIRTDVYSGGVKVRFEQKDGKLVIKAENEAGQEQELGEQEIFKIEERLDKNVVKVATAGGEKFIFSRGNIGATTDFPISIDLATNALNVQTPAGIKQVTILPDQAISNLLSANVISQIGPTSLATLSSELKDVSSVVQLGAKNGIPVYEIAGLKNEKLLGFIPVTIEKTVAVSVETGSIISQEESFLTRILDVLSF